MSDALAAQRAYHVFTADGDVYIDESSDGDRMLHSLVAQYPEATVIPRDRSTGQALARELPLIRLLWLRRAGTRRAARLRGV